eukprot:7034799-Ditylum_brightwellii.AAC.1
MKEATIYGWAEINTKWSLQMIAQANQYDRKIHKHYKLIAASSNKEAGYKGMGGTCMGMVDNIVGRHMESGEDTCGLDRWAYDMYPIKPRVRNSSSTIKGAAYHDRKKERKGNVCKEWDKYI